MSLEAMAVALHHSRSAGTVKLVLLGICNHDGDGGSWPSAASLAKYAGLSGKPENNAKVVRRAVAALVELGEVRVFQQRGGKADTPDYWRPNLYEVTLACPANCDRTKNHRLVLDEAQGAVEVPPGQPAPSPRASQPPPPGPASPEPPGQPAPSRGAEQPPKPSFEPSKNPNTLRPAPTLDLTTADAVADVQDEADDKGSGGFAAFWALWPRKVKRLAAVEAWKRARKGGRGIPPVPADVITDGARRYLAHPEIKAREQRHIPHASTWLNGRQWEDELADPADAPVDGTDTYWSFMTQPDQPRARRPELPKPSGAAVWDRQPVRAARTYPPPSCPEHPSTGPGSGRSAADCPECRDQLAARPGADTRRSA